MGIVELKENKLDGRYAVEIIRDLDRAKQFKQKLTESIEKIKHEIEEKNKELAALEQRVLDSATTYNDEISTLQNRLDIIAQLQDDLETKQNTADGLQTQINLKNQEKTDLENALDEPGLTLEEIAALQAQLAIVNGQLSDLTSQFNAINAEIIEISTNIEELENPQNQVKKVNESTQKFLTVAKDRDKLKYEVLFLQLTQKSKEKRLADYDEIIDDVDARNIWCVDYEVTLEPVIGGDNQLVSIEINDDPTLILLAPRTYTPTADDVNELITAANAKQAEYNEIDAKFNANEAAIEDAKANVDEKRQEIFDERSVITTIPPETSKAERDRIIFESNERLKKLEDELLDLAGKAIALADKGQSYQAKKTLLAEAISRLNNESNKISAAMASASGIYTPAIDQFTKQIQPTQSSGPSAVFYNKALLPGFQKWRPTYRIGTITAIDGDNCTVKLDDATSSQQKLNINQQSTLNDVPIRYGNCNAAVFEVGDNIVVEFKGQDQANPVVIGFQDHPRACGGIVVIPSSDDAPNGWGYPLKEENGTLINPPLGTPGGSNNQYVFSFSQKPESTPHIRRNIAPTLGGNCHSAGKLVSWNGPFGFNIAPPVVYVANATAPDHDGYETQIFSAGTFGAISVSLVSYQRFGSQIYQDGKLKINAPDNRAVLGCGYFGANLVVVVSVNRLRDAIYFLENDGDWNLIGLVDFTDAGNQFVCYRNHCYWFSKDGSHIVSMVPVIEVTTESGGFIRPVSYLKIPRITLVRDETGLINMDSQTIETRFNSLEIVDTKSASGSYFPSGDPQSFSTSRSIINSGNAFMLLGIGFNENLETEFNLKIVAYSITGSSSGSVTGGVSSTGSITAASETNREYQYIISNTENVDIIGDEIQSATSALNRSYFGFNGESVSFTDIQSGESIKIGVAYLSLQSKFFLYLKTENSFDYSQTGNQPGDPSGIALTDETNTISFSLVSSNSLTPLVIDTDTQTLHSETSFSYVDFPFAFDDTNSTTNLSDNRNIDIEMLRQQITGAVDQYGNGIFQFRTPDRSFDADPDSFYNLVVLPKNYTVNSMTSATGDNQKLANIDNLFVPDDVIAAGQIFRI